MDETKLEARLVKLANDQTAMALLLIALLKRMSRKDVREIAEDAIATADQLSLAGQGNTVTEVEAERIKDAIRKLAGATQTAPRFRPAPPDSA